MTLSLRPYQRAAVEALYDYFSASAGNPLVVMPTGCHAAETLILMHDGSKKVVEDVVVGDHLMGPDSRPRRVLQLAHGREPMWRVIPKKGEPFVVNEGHILSLATTNEGKPHRCAQDGSRIDNISVRDYLAKSKYWKHLRKLRRVAVDFPQRQIPVLEPWTLGALLGDGCLTNGIVLSNPDQEVLDSVWAEMERHGLDYNARENGRGTCWGVGFGDSEASRSRPNRVTGILRSLGVAGASAADKFIPDEYRLGSRETRLSVLAGLLDTDGHLEDGTGFDFISKSRRLSDDVVFVARSLGLWAACSACEKFDQNGAGGTFWRVFIAGDTDIILTRVLRKRARPRLQKKNPLVTGFALEPLPVGEFFGFALDGDHLYLTSDFVVHHNTGKSLCIAGFTQSFRQAITEHQIVLGRVKVGGPIVFIHSATDNAGREDGYFYAVVVVAGHRVRAIGEITLGAAPQSDPKYAGLVRVDRHLGDPTQAADANLVAETGGKWTAAHRGQGRAYIAVRLKITAEAFPSGPPNMAAIVEGADTILDPRTGITGWSDNPALCLAWYLTAGFGWRATWDDIDIPCLIAAANICDEIMGRRDGTAERRYTCNGTLSLAKGKIAITEKLVSAMAGALVVSGGRFFVHAGAPALAMATLTSDDLRGDVTIQGSRARRDLFNGVRAVYVEPSANWQSTDAPPLLASNYVAEDGGEAIYTDLEFPLTTSVSTVQRLMKVALERNRRQRTVAFPAKLSALRLRPWEGAMVALDRLVPFRRGSPAGAWRRTAASIWCWPRRTPPSGHGTRPSTSALPATTRPWCCPIQGGSPRPPALSSARR